jgi:hypothetical protein
MAKKQKIIIVDYVRDLLAPNIIHAYTEQGGRLVLYQAIDYRTDTTIPDLYVTRYKQWFHLTRRGKLSHVQHDFSLAHRTRGRLCHNDVRGNQYPSMRHFGGLECHKIVCATFHGSRYLNGIKRECHHIIPDVLDYSADNLIWLTPEEHRRYDTVQRSLRESGRLSSMTPAEILAITSRYHLGQPDCVAEPRKYFDPFIERD